MTLMLICILAVCLVFAWRMAFDQCDDQFPVPGQVGGLSPGNPRSASRG